MPIHANFFRRAILISKVGQTDLAFGMRLRFISRRVHERLQVSVCSNKIKISQVSSKYSVYLACYFSGGKLQLKSINRLFFQNKIRQTLTHARQPLAYTAERVVSGDESFRRRSYVTYSRERDTHENLKTEVALIHRAAYRRPVSRLISCKQLDVRLVALMSDESRDPTSKHAATDEPQAARKSWALELGCDLQL